MSEIFVKPPIPTTNAFIAASWAALALGILSYLVGLWNATMLLSEKGYYFAVLMLGFYSSVSLAKAVRDKAEDIPVTGVYVGISWAAFIVSCLLLVVGLWNAEILLSEKGFYGLAFALSLFGSMAVQKNIRDANGALNLPSIRKKTEIENLSQ